MLPELWYGSRKAEDWRGQGEDEDPDDEQLSETPQDVIDFLGFDPLEFDEMVWKSDYARVLKSNPYHDVSGAFTDKAHAFQGVTALSKAKNNVLAIKAKNSLMRVESKEVDGELRMSYVHGFYSEAVATRELSVIREMYGSMPKVVIDQVRSMVFVTATLPLKLEQLGESIISEEIRTRNAQTEKELETKEVSHIERRGGEASGITPSYNVTYKDGTKGFFKTADAVEEVGVWELAKVVGMDDLATPVVFRRVGTPDQGDVSGCMMKFIGNAKNAVKCTNAEKYDDKDGYRAALFDYVIGNTDRHEGNWMVDTKGKLHLIDHGYAFTDSETNSALLAHIQKLVRKGTVKYQLNDLKSVYIDNKDAILVSLKKSGVGHRKVEETRERLDGLARMSSWTEIP